MFVKQHDIDGSTVSLVQRILNAMDTPRSLAVWLLFRDGEHAQLVDLECDPSTYVDAALFAKDYQATKLLSKANFLRGLPSPREKAELKFFESEEACRATNRRVVSIIRGNSPAGIHAIIHRTIQLVASVLGEVPHEDILDSCGWGPGVSSSCKGVRTTGYDKFTSKPEVTPELLPVAHHVLNAWRPWPSVVLEAFDTETGLPLPVSLMPNVLPTVRGNKVAFVPKNSKTDRPIAIEPTVNAFLQKGIGTVLRKKLRKAGVDLSDQGKNRQLARKGSVDGLTATIDLESASDTIAVELVRLLLPPAWFQLLDLARSKFGTYNGNTFFWEKFSSMGNGFTFELESILFWALARSVSDEAGSAVSVSIYGDDLICDSQIVERLDEVYRFCGFTISRKKSFHSGSFRESCGADFFRGLNVRPFFLKEEPVSPMQWLFIANALRDHSTRQTEGMFSCKTYQNAWRFCVSRIPKPFRLFGPKAANGVIWIPSSEKQFSTWNGNSHKVWCNDVVTHRSAGRDVGGLLLSSWLYSKDSPTYGKFSHRGVWSVRRRTHIFPVWDDDGVWG